MGLNKWHYVTNDVVKFALQLFFYLWREYRLYTHVLILIRYGVS